MNKINYIIVIFFLILVSCSQDDGTCPCHKQSRSGGGLFNGEVDEGYCTGEIENLSPTTVFYSRVCG